jgi:hypothetical protein
VFFICSCYGISECPPLTPPPSAPPSQSNSSKPSPTRFNSTAARHFGVHNAMAAIAAAQVARRLERTGYRVMKKPSAPDHAAPCAVGA